MNTVIIDGVMRSGKTLIMVLLTNYYKQQSNCTLFSNFGMTDALPFHNFLDFLTVAQQPSSIICLDEAHSIADSRSFNDAQIKYFTQLVYYFGKLRTTVFFTTPDMETLDKRVKKVCNLYIHVRKDAKYFYYTMYDYQSSRVIRKARIRRDLAYFLIDGLYDSDALVHPVNFPDKQAIYDNFVIQLSAVHDEYRKKTGVSSATTFKNSLSVLQAI